MKQTYSISNNDNIYVDGLQLLSYKFVSEFFFENFFLRRKRQEILHTPGNEFSHHCLQYQNVIRCLQLFWIISLLIRQIKYKLLLLPHKNIFNNKLFYSDIRFPLKILLYQNQKLIKYFLQLTISEMERRQQVVVAGVCLVGRWVSKGGSRPVQITKQPTPVLLPLVEALQECGRSKDSIDNQRGTCERRYLHSFTYPCLQYQQKSAISLVLRLLKTIV